MLIGGSADLSPSTNTTLQAMGDFQNPQKPEGDRQGAVGGVWGYEGRNIHFGVREHAMGAMLNGIARPWRLCPFWSNVSRLLRRCATCHSIGRLDETACDLCLHPR